LLTLCVASTVVPLKNVTVPVAAVGVTVAVSVNGWPSIDGLEFETSVTELCGAITLMVNDGEVLAPNAESPT
jgi:hypothetical protein